MIVCHRRAAGPIMLGSFLVQLCGCGLGGSGIKPPSVSPAAAARKAIETFDKDGNGSLSHQEATACPAISAAFARYDADTDGQISAGEVESRFASLFDSGTGLIGVTCTVKRGGRPLANAVVRFTPEPFFDGALQSAIGTSDADGVAYLAIADGELADGQRGRDGMQAGVYRIEIEHPSVGNLAKPLGREVDPFTRGATDVVIDL